MSAQPAKRRKTSPSAATPVFARNERPASEKRASYMSPTRASLSRFNPSLLPQNQARSMSAGPVAAGQNIAPKAVMTPDQMIARGQEAFNFIMGNFNAQMQKTLSAFNTPEGNANAFANLRTPTGMTPSIFGNAQGMGRVETPLGEETDEQMEEMRKAIRARKDAERRGSVLGAMATPTSVGKALPAAAFELPTNEEDDELSIEIGRNEAQIPRAGSVRSPQSAVKPMSEIVARPSDVDEMQIDPAIDEELEIDELSPDAPKRQPPVSRPRVQRLATEDDGLPDTPEAIRRQLEAEDHPRRGVLYSSPSKKRRSLGSPKKRKSQPEVVVVEARPEIVEKPTAAHDEERIPETAPEASKVVQPTAPDPQLLAKREEKAKLDKELRQLYKEIDSLEGLAHAYSEAHGDDGQDFNAAINLLTSNSSASKRHAPEPALSSLLTSFLPFSIPSAPDLAHEKDPKFISHEPLKEEDPLPLNTLFTPLTITSVTHAPTSASDSPATTLQKHTITLSSPSSLLSCELDMTVSSQPGKENIPSIQNLTLNDLSPWARMEIGDWIELRCKEGDVAGIGYALGRYWDICVKRAQCWRSVGKTFPGLVEGPDGVGDEEITSSHMSRKALLPRLGRSVLTLQSDDAEVRILWKLSLDWTGEVESAISVEPILPRSWHEADTTNALRKIPATFDALMRERGVLKAVEVVGGLVFDTRA